MGWGKKVVSYLLWAVYTLAIFLAMAGMESTFCSGLGLPSWFGLVATAAMMALVGCVAVGLHRAAPGIAAYFKKRDSVRRMAEAALVVVFLAVGLALRVRNLESADVGVYYEAAKVSIGNRIPQITHGAIYFYLQLLRLVFAFLGNEAVFGIILQMALQCVAALSIFFLLRKNIGFVTALVALGLFACAPYMVRAGLTLSPEMLYLCLFAAAAAVIAVCGKRRAPLLMIVAGGFGAILAYLDIAGLLLLLLGLFICLRSGEGGCSRPGRKAVSGICCVLGFVMGFAVCILADSVTSQKAFVGVLKAWFMLYRPGQFQIPAAVNGFDVRGDGLVLLGFMMFGIYSFWFERKRDRLMIWIPVVAVVAAAGCFGVFTEEMPGMMFLYLLFLIMAGVSLEQCFGRRRVRMTEEEPEEFDEWELMLAEGEEAYGEPGFVEEETYEEPAFAEEEYCGEPEFVGEEAYEEPEFAEEEETDGEPGFAEEETEGELVFEEEETDGEPGFAEEETEGELVFEEEETDGEPEFTEEEEADGELTFMGDMGDKKPDKKMTPPKEREMDEELASAFGLASEGAAEEAEETEEEAEEEEKKPRKKEVQYLENPLPLPKKHVKKVLDYDYTVSEDDDFDYEV